MNSPNFKTYFYTVMKMNYIQNRILGDDLNFLLQKRHGKKEVFWWSGGVYREGEGKGGLVGKPTQAWGFPVCVK